MRPTELRIVLPVFALKNAQRSITFRPRNYGNLPFPSYNASIAARIPATPATVRPVGMPAGAAFVLDALADPVEVATAAAPVSVPAIHANQQQLSRLRGLKRKFTWGGGVGVHATIAVSSGCSSSGSGDQGGGGDAALVADLVVVVVDVSSVALGAFGLAESNWVHALSKEKTLCSAVGVIRGACWDYQH
jgi:hypothetical protein